MLIESWSDITCPWCYVARKNLHEALDRFGGEVDLVWRAFELVPELPDVYPGSFAERIVTEYGWTAQEAAAYCDSLRVAGAAVGGDFRFDLVRMANSFDAHRLVKLAGRYGLADQAKSVLAEAYWSEGAVLTDPLTLDLLAHRAGLPIGAVLAMLASDDFRDDVRDDERRAKQLGIDRAPTLVLAGAYRLVGAHDVDTFTSVLQQVADRPLPDGGGLVSLAAGRPPASFCTAESCIV